MEDLAAYTSDEGDINDAASDNSFQLDEIAVQRNRSNDDSKASGMKALSEKSISFAPEPNKVKTKRARREQCHQRNVNGMNGSSSSLMSSLSSFGCKSRKTANDLLTSFSSSFSKLSFRLLKQDPERGMSEERADMIPEDDQWVRTHAKLILAFGMAFSACATWYMVTKLT